MEVDFDKEIDAILRKARPKTPILFGDTASPHLDADELSAFAENAMPESAKRLYTVHLAECDRCRKLLSDIILLNAEAETVSAAAAAPTVAVEAAMPWYRRLFLFPNLAYVMGALVLMFSGFMGYLVLQNAGGDASGDRLQISQLPEEQRGSGGPNYADEPLYPVASANTASNTAMSNANANAANRESVRVVPQDSAAPAETDKLARKDEIAKLEKAAPASGQGVTLDGVTSTAAPPPPASAPMAAAPAKPTANEADVAAKQKEDEMADESKVLSERSISNLPQVGRQSAKRSAGPVRNQQNQFPNRAENQYVVTTRTVGGRKFEQKQGVWYDTAYSGQATTNIRRGTDAFKDLDTGLRSIANSLSGTVVVIWNGKAYRIQ